MRCFNHQDNEASAVCLACGKACCERCIHSTEPTVSCSADCQQRIDENIEIIERTKMIYGIGEYKTNKPVLSSQTVFLLAFGFFMLAFSLYSWQKRGFQDVSLLFIGMGLLFTGMGAFTLIRNLKIRMRV